MRQSRQKTVARNAKSGRSTGSKSSGDVSVRALRRKLEQLDKKIATRKTLIKDLHKVCKHPFEQIIECAYRDKGWLGCDRPFRVCKACGYAEEGWGCGYWKLAPRVYEGIPTLGRDQAFKYVLRYHSQDDMYKLKYPERFDKDGNEL